MFHGCENFNISHSKVYWFNLCDGSALLARFKKKELGLSYLGGITVCEPKSSSVMQQKTVIQHN